MSSELFHIENMAKSFGGLKAIDDLTFNVEKGSIYSIIGPNGAGKSTIFNCINGLYRINGGKIIFKGRDISRLSTHTIASLGIARTFQNIELFTHMTTMDNLLLGRHLHMGTKLWEAVTALFRITPGARKEIRNRRRVEEIIEFLELESFRDQFVKNLPYGKQKMVELGRALAMEPEILLLDEPAAGLNQEEREDLVFWIKDIRDEFGITVLLIEHNMQVVTGISDKILAINFGKKITEGSPEDVVSHPEVIEAYLGG